MPDLQTMIFMSIVIGMVAVYAISAAIFACKGKKRNHKKQQ